MSIIETLTEGMVNRNLQQEGAALLNKWTATGLLEGLSSDNDKHNMARLLENQARELLRESSGMGAAGSVEGFAAVAFPIVRRVFAGLIANDLVSVQPMSLPSGLIFFMDFTFSGNLGNQANDVNSRFGNAKDTSIYGTAQTGSGVIGGVDLVDSTFGSDLSGPGRGGSTGYAYASPTTGSNALDSSGNNAKMKTTFVLDGAVSEANAKLLEYDVDLLSKTDGTLSVIVVEIDEDALPNADFDNLSAISILDLAGHTSLTTPLMPALNSILGVACTDSNSEQVRRLTRKITAAEASYGNAKDGVRLIIVTQGTCTLTTAANLGAGVTKDNIEYPVKDTATSAGTGGAIDTFSMVLEGSEDIPEIDIKVDSTAITAQTKKLKAKWTPELGQDLNAYHNLDAEVELTSILSEQIALELDREILADLVNGATAATYYWSRSPGLFVDRLTGAELGATSAAPDFTGTVSEWYETLIETINDVSAQIHRKTLRGGANFVVVSPEVANILEFTAGFRANVTADADKGDIGAVKAGSLNRKFDIIVDPYFPRNAILVGRKGNSFLESGYVYAPYVPLQTTPTIFGPEDFVPRKGVMTRYAKKMVRPDMYGLVIVRGLLGESGS